MRISGTPSLSAILLLIAGVAVLVLTSQDEGRDGRGKRADVPAKARSVPATVVRIVDGDTVVVEIDGAEDRVRYIGVDTPESVIPGEPAECFGSEASELNRRLVEGRRVRLEFGAERRDPYDRLLAYVRVGDTFVNAELLRLGAARTLEIAPNTGFAERFAELEAAAATAGRGLWAVC